MKSIYLIILFPGLCHAQIATSAGDFFNCDTPLQINTRGNTDTDNELETRWVAISNEVRDLLFDGCENTSQIDKQYTLTVNENQWLPFNQFYSGSAVCNGNVDNLPPGMVRDSVCNIYGTPNAVGRFVTQVGLDDGNLWQIEFTVINDDSTPPPPASDFQKTLPIDQSAWLPFNQFYNGSASCTGAVENLPPGMVKDSVCNLYGTPNSAGDFITLITLNDDSVWRIAFTITAENPPPVNECADGVDNDNDGFIDAADPGCADGTELPDDSVSNPPAPEFTAVRAMIPDTPADGLYPPQSSSGGERWAFQKTQLENFVNDCSVDGSDCWRYDPVKTLYEHCRKAQLHSEESEACTLADHYADYFLSHQHWNTSGLYPDCSGGASLAGGNDKCDPKYGAHASVAYYKGVSYSPEQQQMMKAFCTSQGWSFGPITVDSLEEGFTERTWGLALQCLVDLQKMGVDTQTERADYINKLYAMFSGDYSGQVIGAPMHSMDGHECSNYCPHLDYWMFSPWMGSAFLIPALWEHWVFMDKDPRIAEMIVKFGDAMLAYGLFNPDINGYGFRMNVNPTPWVTHYFAIPYDTQKQAQQQESEGGYSDLHNPESIFALSAAYFFSCNPQFKDRIDAMYPIFNQANARQNSSPHRIYLWANRGSASTEWLLENANCPTL